MTIGLIIRLLYILFSIMAEAALFVYRPERFKALPYIILATMMLLYFFGPILHYQGMPPEHLCVYRGLAGVWLPAIIAFRREFLLITALPIFTLLVTLIVRKSQRMKGTPE